MAMQLCRNIRCYAKKIALPAKGPCGGRFSMDARSYSSAPLSQIQVPPPAVTPSDFRLVVKVSAAAFFVWWAYSFGFDGPRRDIANWRAEKKAQAMLKKLKSEKNSSAEAYLVALEREFNALKAELFNRPADAWAMSFLKMKADVLQLNIKQREIHALQEMVFSWDYDEDD